MRPLTAIALVLLLVGCSRPKDVYFILLGDSSRPAYAEVEVGGKIDGSARLVVFSQHSGSVIRVAWDGKETTVFDGSGSFVFQRKAGLLEISGVPEKEVYLYIVHGALDGSRGVVLDKKRLTPKAPFTYSRNLE